MVQTCDVTARSGTPPPIRVEFGTPGVEEGDGPVGTLLARSRPQPKPPLRVIQLRGREVLRGAAPELRTTAPDALAEKPQRSRTLGRNVGFAAASLFWTAPSETGVGSAVQGTASHLYLFIFVHGPKTSERT